MLKFKLYRTSLFLMPALLLFISGGFAASQEETKGGVDIPGSNKVEPEKAAREYLYDPTGKTDPFRSFITEREEKAEKDKEKPRTYLETLELSQLSLTAIVISNKGKWAMVKDSKDMGHVIKEGTPIGTNGGVVHQIKEGEVVIREEYKDFRGNLQYRDISKKSPTE